MTVDRAVLIMAGAMILAALALSHWVSPWFGLVVVVVGANMLQAGFTGFCPAAMVFKRLGLRPGPAFT